MREHLRQGLGQELNEFFGGGIVEVAPKETIVTSLVLVGLEHSTLVLVQVRQEFVQCPAAHARIFLASAWFLLKRKLG